MFQKLYKEYLNNSGTSEGLKKAWLTRSHTTNHIINHILGKDVEISGNKEPSYKKPFIASNTWSHHGSAFNGFEEENGKRTGSIGVPLGKKDYKSKAETVHECMHAVHFKKTG